MYYSSKYQSEEAIPDTVSFTEYVLDRASPGGMDRGALMNGESRIVYSGSEVMSLISKTASSMSKLGVDKGDIVGFLLPNSPESLMMLCGTLLVGGIASVTDPMYPLDTIKQTLGTVSPRVLVTNKAILTQHTESLLRTALPSVRHIILLDGECDRSRRLVSLRRIWSNTGDYPVVPIDPRIDIAMIVFLGASESFKGVCISHYNLVAAIEAMDTVKEYSEEKGIVMNTLPLSTLSVTMTCGLVFKKPVIILPQWSPPALLSLCERHKVTTIWTTPYRLDFFATSPLIIKHNLNSLRQIISSDFVPGLMSPERSQAIRNRFEQGVEIKNIFSAPEFGALSFGEAAQSSQVGHLLANMRAKIINDSGQPLSPNRAGILCVEGASLMLGYLKLGKPDCNSFDSLGYFHTGHTGYFSTDGVFYLTSRKKANRV